MEPGKIISYIQSNLEELGYDDVHGISLSLSMDGWGANWYAYDEPYDDDIYQGRKAVWAPYGGPEDLMNAVRKVIDEIPDFESRQLRFLAGKMAGVVEFSKSTDAIAAKAYGEAFADKLNELRASLSPA